MMAHNRWILRFYRLLLRCYPAQFRAEFGAEMEQIFALLLAHAMTRGAPAVAALLAREYAGAAIGALHEQLRGAGPHSDRRLRIVRLQACMLATLSSVWWMAIVLLNEDVRRVESLPIGIALFFGFAGSLIAWRRERSGGVLLIAGGIGVSMVLLLGAGPHSERLALLLPLPYLVSGALLLVSGAYDPAQRIAPAPLGVAGVAALALVEIALFAWVLALTEIGLVPYDTVGEPVRPPIGTLARTVNDFFESGAGAFAPAILLLAGSLITLAARMRIAPGRMLRPGSGRRSICSSSS
jgi:hypothetical protein